MNAITKEQRQHYAALEKAVNDAYLAIKPQLDALDAQRAALKASTYTPAEEALEAFIEELDGNEAFAHCEGCSAPIFDGDSYAADPDDPIYFCEDCVKRWNKAEDAA